MHSVVDTWASLGPCAGQWKVGQWAGCMHHKRVGQLESRCLQGGPVRVQVQAPWTLSLGHIQSLLAHKGCVEGQLWQKGWLRVGWRSGLS